MEGNACIFLLVTWPVPLQNQAMDVHPNKPPRLSRIFQCYDSPIYFVTFCTHARKQILDSVKVNSRFCRFAGRVQSKGVAFGRYVLMPDHVHCFICIGPDRKLGDTIRLLKRSLSAAIQDPMPHWQPGFFDHLLRHQDSYSSKWEYVRQNPVRAGLVEKAEEWPYQGEIVRIRYS